MDTRRLMKNVYAFGIIAGSIIGVGFFSLPYIASKVGLQVMLGFFIFLGIFSLVEHLLFAEVALHTPDYKRMPGFAKYYLGKWGERIAYFVTIFTSFLGMLVYYLVGSKFLQLLLQPKIGGTETHYLGIYFALVALLVYFGVSVVSKLSLFSVFSICSIFFIIISQTWTNFSWANLSVQLGSVSDMFLPYGAIVFALWGVALIPEAEEYLKEDKDDLQKILPIALLVPFIFYIAFTIFILGVSGAKTTPDALGGLTIFLSPLCLTLALSMGVLSTFNACVCMGLTLKKVLHYDLKINKTLAWFLACFVPLFLYFAGVNNFVRIIGFIGAFVMGIEGIMVLLMYKKLRSETFNIYPLMMVFLLGMIFEIIIFFKLI